MSDSWLKLGNTLPDHERIRELDYPEAAWLYVAAICYCDRMRTDGFVPKKMIPHLTSLKKPDKLLADLIRVGLCAMVDSRVEVLRYLDHNRSAAEIRAKEEQRSRAGKHAAGVRWGSKSDANRMRSRNESHANEDAISMPEKSRVENIKTKGLKDKSGATHADAPLFESFWAEYPPQKNGSKPEKKLAHDQWQRLKPAERQQALDSVQHYKTHLRQTDQYSKHAFRYLRDRSFEAYLSPPVEVVTPPPKGHNARNFDSVVQRLGVANGTDGSTTDYEVPLRGLPQGRLE